MVKLAILRVFHINVSYRRILSVLSHSQMYSSRMPRIGRRLIRRTFDCTSYLELWHADTGVVHYSDETETQHSRYVLVVVDIGSHFLFARPLATREAEECTRAFADICYAAGGYCTTLATDDGGEFKGKFAAFCKDHRIVWRPKIGANKALLLASNVRIVWRKLCCVASIAGAAAAAAANGIMHAWYVRRNSNNVISRLASLRPTFVY